MILSHVVILGALIAWGSFDDPDDPEQAADETIHVEFWDGSAWVDRTNNATYVHNINYSRNPPDVTLTDDCSGLWRIWSADNTTPSEPGGLGRVTFHNGFAPTAGITLLISRNGNALNTMGPPEPSSGSAVVGCHNWDGLTITSSDRDRVRLQAHISGDLRNSVIVGHIHRLDIGGNLRGPAISAECETSPTVLISSQGDFLDLGDRPIHAIIVGGDVGVEDPCDRPAGWSGVETIDSVEGDITLIEVGGDLYTYVNVPQGTLGALNVTGAIGSPENPASINAKNIGADTDNGDL
ncbi:MAG: hypothetical protein IT439_09695 [Phycisphaerales bacterium]|nr:hypothetical protein [Phycisphaerales bacterium]